jgi:BACON domain-containing protein/putative Ig domain-containing protein
MPAAILLLATLLVPDPAWAADIEFLTQELPWAIAEKDYSPPPLESRASGTCPLGGVGYAVVSGALPAGVRLSRLGYFSGTPKHTGSTDFTVRVSSGCTWAAKRFTLVVTGAPVLAVTPARLMFEPLGEAQVLHVSATWPKLAYQASSSADWLKAAPEHGFTPREGSAMAEDRVRVSIDRSQLKPGRYSATITFSAWQALNAPAVVVELTVP